MNLEDRSPAEIRDVADDHVDDDWAEIRAIEERDVDWKGLKAEAWARKAVATGELPDRLDLLQEMARDEDWRVRERVAMALKHVNARSFEQVAGAWDDWVDHEDPEVRRACEVGLMGVEPAHVADAFDVLDELVDDSNDYVKKSCGAFAVSNLAGKNPEAARPYLDRWSRSDDLRTRWNVAKAIGASYGKRDEYAIELARRLAADEEYRVRRATASAVREMLEAWPDLRDEMADWEAGEDFESLL